MDILEKYEDRDSFFHWFLIASLAGIEIDETMRKIPRIVTMQLNGVEINPEAAIKRLEEQFDRMVTEKAQELLEELKQDILEPFENKVKEMTDAIETLIDTKIGKIPK